MNDLQFEELVTVLDHVEEGYSAKVVLRDGLVAYLAPTQDGKIAVEMDGHSQSAYRPDVRRGLEWMGFTGGEIQ